MEELAAQLDDVAVRSLLGLSVYPDPLRLEQTCQRYRQGFPWQLLGCRRDGIVVGCIGLELLEEGRATVHNLAVLPDQQRHGIGRALLHEIVGRYGLSWLELETDKDAVAFYQRCGFSVTSLGETYPGVERFRCVWQAWAARNPLRG